MKEVYNEHVIASIEISDSMEILFYYDFFNDKIWANIRKFVKSKKYMGPTKQGVKFDPTQIVDIKKAFDVAQRMEQTMMDEEFHRFAKSSSRDIVVHASNYKGELGVDIREWVHTDKFTGWTRSGIRFSVTLLPQVIAALDKMLHTTPVLKELTNQHKIDFDANPASSAKSLDKQAKIEGIPDKLQQQFESEEEHE